MQRGHNIEALPPESAFASAPAEFGNSHRYVSNEKPIRAKGYVCITNQNIGRKHDERVFFVPAHAKPYRPTVQDWELKEWRTAWKYLVADYRAKAEKIINYRKKENIALNAYEGRNIGETALSRHICRIVDDRAADTLKPGDLCYANIGSDGTIKGLYPVMISREIARLAPLDLVSKDLVPARSLNELSPADRVFGWVQQADGGWQTSESRAHKGQIRIASLRYMDCKDGNGNDQKAITPFEGEGLPLAILSTPKPEQVRFYVAKDKQGSPQPDGIGKLTAAYDQGITSAGPQDKGLRGRKVYPHHRGLPEEYWNGPAAFMAALERPDQPQTVGAHFREYVRIACDSNDPRNLEKNRKKQRDDQNRSIGGWVNPDARFRAEIDISNLSEVELGALLFLLTLPDDCYFRLGGGKPLGFGSVRVTLASLDLRDGIAIRQELLSILFDSKGDGKRLCALDAVKATAAARDFVDVFITALSRAYGDGSTGISQIPFVTAFLNATRGFVDGQPVHYPRAAPSNWDGKSVVAPNPEGKNYEWFVANDRSSRFESGLRQALDPLWAPTGLSMVILKDEMSRGFQRSSPGQSGAGTGRGGRR
jgi:CRISPR-associated protein (TIGR03986 family)